MTALVIVRHGPTEWNEIGRVQGRGDVPLSEAGRAEVRRWRLPDEFASFQCVTSPLCRATETAALLGLTAGHSDQRLVEMHWGSWEGQDLRDLRRQLGDLMKAWEAKGLDFKAPDGESPREVQARLMPFLAECAAAAKDTVVVAHKGVIRAVYALAVGWDMTGPPPNKLRDGCAHHFVLATDGMPRIGRLNIDLNADPSS